MEEEQKNWARIAENDPEWASEWLRMEAERGIAHLRADGALRKLNGGPSVTTYLHVHVESNCLFHMMTNYRGMLAAVYLATKETVAFVQSLPEEAQEQLEDWIPTQTWRCLAKEEIALPREVIAEIAQARDTDATELDERFAAWKRGPKDRQAVPMEPGLPSGGQLFPRDAKRLARRDLRAAFPGVTFAITSRYRPGGAAMTVDWEEGPEEEEVKALLDKYRGYFKDVDYNPEDYWPRKTVVDGKIVSSDLKYISLYRRTSR